MADNRLSDIYESLKWANPVIWPNCGKAEPPARLKRDGFLAYADGVNWDPGDGKGIYQWDGTSQSWVKISGGGGSGGGGDMYKSVYDTDNDGVVDNAKKIDGRKIYVMSRPPQSGEGENGDIWIEYQE